MTTSLSPSSISGSTSSILESTLYPALFRQRSQSIRAVPQSDNDIFISGPNHDCSTAGCQRVVINVSGQRFETQLRTLNRFPQTLLGDAEKRKTFWDDERKEFFLDRHRPTFQAILYFYQSGGRLRRPVEVPEDVFLDELSFYQLGEEVIQAFRQKEGILGEPADDDCLYLLPDDSWQKKVWLFCEEPDSSKEAKVFAIISIICIIVSVTSFCLETLPSIGRQVCIMDDLQVPPPVGLDGYLPSSNGVEATNFTTLTSVFLPNSSSEDRLKRNSNGYDKEPRRHNYAEPFFIVETICVVWFTLEFLLRLISSPSKQVFCRSIMNMFDLLAIVPYFVVLGMQLSDDKCDSERSAGGSFVIVRILRVVRIFKLSKHSQGLRILGLTIKTSMHELGMFFFFLIVAMVIFSSAVYYAEAGEEKTQLTSIPGAFWWAVVTMTTVGYGDVTPVGVWGKLVGTLCVIAGVLTIALPVPVVVANFNNFYRHEI